MTPTQKPAEKKPPQRMVNGGLVGVGTESNKRLPVQNMDPVENTLGGGPKSHGKDYKK